MAAVVPFEKQNENLMAIGRTSNAAMQLDLLKLIETRMLICANSGSGKSTLMRLVVERAAGKIPFLILDWEGEFVTLREKLDVVLVGHEGEIPIDLRSASLLAHKLIELHASAIIDLSDLVEPDKKRKYAADFLDALIHLPRPLWNPTLIGIDEAHQLAPEKDNSVSARSVINLMSLGRKRSLCGILASQRLSKLHKDAIAECQNVFIGNTWLDIDQKRAGDILGISNSDRQNLRELGKGEFFAFGPALWLKGVQRFQADDSQTKPPKAGERHRLLMLKTSDVVSHIASQLADLPQKAEEEIRDLEAAKKKIGELERELKSRVVKPEANIAAQAGAPPAEQSFREAEADYQRELDRVRREAKQQLNKTVAGYEKALDGLRERLREIGRLAHLDTAEPPAQPLVVKHKPYALKPIPAQSESTPVRQPPRPSSAGSQANSLGKCERAILSVLAQYPNGKAKTQIAVIAGYSHHGGGFNNALSALRSRGFIEGGKEQVKITGQGIEALGDFEPLPTGSELAGYWMRQLGRAERTLLQALVERYPDALHKTELGSLTGYEPNGGGFNNALSKLRTLELISGTREALKASENLF